MPRRFPEPRRAGPPAALLILMACAPGRGAGPGVVAPTVERPAVVIPADSGAGPQLPTVNPPPVLRRPIVPPELAHQRGFLPRDATGTVAFLAEQPRWDGRGVLLGILDSGLDAGVPGFDSTTAGRPKVVDLRDFSGEGAIALSAPVITGDTVALAGRRLTGVGRVRGLVAGSLLAGLFLERPLGDPPASDVNDNATDSDSLLIVVGKASDGWVLFADTDGDGSLANERPVRDFLAGGETFGWHRAGAAPPLTIAANFRETAREPRLDLFFDTSGHGTHVAGIAAARGIGGIPGFDGAAPGAQLLGLKIARNDFGGITTTGSVLDAMDYAIRFAAGRRMPLVLNMSFGVGNAREGAARLDAIIDSVLDAHPDVIFVTSAGNDGPGLSTMGFPGSARRAITVGGTEPSALSEAAIRTGRLSPDVLLHFSSRGGELAKPDVVVPGIAYSTVPRWDTGEEVKGGTSMASPHVAGLAAALASAALAERRSITAADVRRALVGSAKPVAGGNPFDAGAGVPDLARAWSILRGPAPPAEFDVETPDRPGSTAAFRIAPGSGDTLVRFRVSRRRGAGPVDLTLTSDASWLAAPKMVRIAGNDTVIELVQHPPREPGEHVGAVRATAPGVAGPLFTLVSGVVVPDTRIARPVRVSARLAPGAARRVTFAVDSGRPFQVRLSTAAPRERLIAALHQPGGQPIPGDNGIPGGFDSAAAVLEVDGRDARAGYYEAVAVAPSGTPLTATIEVDHAPFALTAAASGDSLTTMLRSLADSAVAGRLRAGILGGERKLAIGGAGGPDVVTPVLIPAWARRIVIDLEMDPALWPRFTDFGFTLLDAEGRILGKEPVNYPGARLAIELPVVNSDRAARLVLSPAFADPGSREAWTTRISIRLESDRAMNLGTPEGIEVNLGPGESRVLRSGIGALPWKLPDGYGPLGLFLLESGGVLWSWEHALGNPASR
jgi:subtilisin family serine protease